MVYCRVGKVIIELDQYVIGNIAWIHITDWRLSLVTQHTHTHVVASGTVYCCIWFATPPMMHLHPARMAPTGSQNISQADEETSVGYEVSFILDPVLFQDHSTCHIAIPDCCSGLLCLLH